MRVLPKPKKIYWALIFIFFLFSTAIGSAGYFFYQRQREGIRREKWNELKTVADLKVKQITAWRKERLGDAKVILENPFIADFVQLLNGDPENLELKEKVVTWMSTLKNYYDYESVFLLDPKGAVRLSVSGNKRPLCAYTRQMIAEATRTRKIVLTDLHRSEPDDHIHIDLIIPILALKAHHPSLVALLLLQINPDWFLYPFIQEWPTPSKSAETLLVRREEEEVVFLTELRHRKGTALTLRLPIKELELPAAMAARGQEGIVEGLDYRGVEALAAIRRIPDSPWVLISKVDQEEIYAPILEQAKEISIVAGILITGVGLCISLLWRGEHLKFQRQQYEAEIERLTLAQRLDYLSRHANDMILLADPDFKIIEANERAKEAYGYTDDEMTRLSLIELHAPEARLTLDEQIKRVEELGGYIFETLHQRKDGTKFPVEISSRLIEGEGRKLYQSIIRDITERKRLEGEKAQLYEGTQKKMQELEARQKIISAIIKTLDLNELLSIALTEIMQLIRVEMAGIYLIEQGRLILRTSRGLPDDLLASIRDLPLAETTWATETVVRRERLSEETVQADEIYKNAGVQSWGAIPFKVKEKSIGSLFIASRRYETFSDGVLQTLSALAEIIAVGIENARLYTEAQERLARLITLREIDRAIAARLSLEDVMAVVLKQVSPHIVGVDGVGFSLIDWEKRCTELALLHLPGDVYIRGEAFGLSESLLHYLAVDRQPVIIYDLQGDPRVQNHRNVIRQYHLKSYLGVPLTVQDQVIGVLHILTTLPRHFRDEEVDFFATMAGQAAIAVRNAQLYQTLTESEAKYRSLFENSKDAVYISSKDGSLIDINRAAVDLFGYKKEELLSMKIENLYANPSDGIKFMAEIEEQGFVKDYSVDFKKKDGTILSTLIMAAVQEGEDGSVTGYEGIIRDVTERKREEEDRKRLFEQIRASRERLRDLSRQLVDVQEAERRELVRKLHDEVGQNLTALSINLNIVADQLPEETTMKIGTRINDSLKLVEEMVERIRDVMTELRPLVLDDYGVSAALHWYGKQFSERTGIATVLQVEELTPRLPLSVETALFRIAQEALTNVVKYARAKSVILALEEVDGEVLLAIVDDGVGFDIEGHEKPGGRPGWGITNMRERVQAVGGCLHVETAPGKGTKIVVEVPRK